ncbi:MAG: nucleoside triphosphate hydrolase, partial [Dietzia cercidiphylli]
MSPESGSGSDPHRKERSAQIHSADVSETLFSTGSSLSAGAGAGDRLAEAVEVMARIRRDGEWEAAQTHAS